MRHVLPTEIKNAIHVLTHMYLKASELSLIVLKIECRFFFSFKVAILLTGGRQSPDGGSLQEAMRPMRDLDVTTYVIAIGSQSDVPVQRPEDLFTVTSFDDLPRQVQPIATNITKPSGIH